MKSIVENINEARQVSFRIGVTVPNRAGAIGVDVKVDSKDAKDFRTWCENEIGNSLYSAEDETGWVAEF